MKNYTKKQFLDEVTQEIENIKKFTTKQEKQNLNIYYFDPDNKYYCIYGQLTGSCESRRAIELMNKCCKRYCFFYFDIENSFLFHYREIKRAIWHTQMPDNFFDSSGCYYVRNFSYYSLLEAFIKYKNANNESIISYIKGKTNKLVLEKKN